MASTTSPAPDFQLRHLKGLPEGVPIVKTVGFRTTQVTARRAINDGEIAAFVGGAGLGKTFAVDHAVRASGLSWIWVQIGPVPRPKEVTSRLLKALTGVFPDGTLYELTDDLVDSTSNLWRSRHGISVQSLTSTKETK